MKLQQQEIQILETLICDEAFEINFFSIEFANGEKLEINN